MQDQAIFEVAWDDVRPDETQPRKVFTPEHLDTMAETFRERGQITPARIRPDGGDGPTPYVIVDGECRWRVGSRLHEQDPEHPLFAMFRVYVHDVDPADLLVVQYLSNTGLGHTPGEKAEVLQRLLDAGTPRNKLRSKLGITSGQFRFLREFLHAPGWLRPYSVSRIGELPALDDTGTPLRDADGKPVITKTTIPPLPLTHLAVLTRAAVRLVKWDREQQKLQPDGEHQNVAQSTITKLADKAVRQRLPVKRLTTLCAAAVERVESRDAVSAPVARRSVPPFERSASGALRIPITDPGQLTAEARLVLVTELDSVVAALRAPLRETPFPLGAAS